jgi:hypothetical protein
MNRQTLLILALALLPFVAVGCDKKTGTSGTPVTPASTSGSEPKKADMPPAPGGVSPAIQAAVEREWPKVEAAGAEVEAAFKNVETARSQGKPPSAADVTRAKDAQSKTEEWANIWNDFNDMVDAKKITKSQAAATERYLQEYDRKVQKWQKLAKTIKELSTVK